MPKKGRCHRRGCTQEGACCIDHRIILVINEIDKPAAEPDKVVDQTFEFLELGANDEQIEFQIVYASAKNGFAKKNADDEDKDMTPLLIRSLTLFSQSLLPKVPFQFR